MWDLLAQPLLVALRHNPEGEVSGRGTATLISGPPRTLLHCKLYIKLDFSTYKLT